LDFIGAKDDGGGGGALNVQSTSEIVTTNTQFFYRPDVLPVTQPTVSEH